MPRYKLTLEYNGTGFAGWQKQEDRPSIQQSLEEALLRLTGEQAEVVGAGRTDAGVHASGQAAHVDIVKKYDPYRLMMGLNAQLREGWEAGHPMRQAISVHKVEETAPDFHARFHATRRYYTYRILNRRAPAAMDSTFVWHVPVPLNTDAMHKAAQYLLGAHDFTSFRDSQCQAKSPLKTLDFLHVERNGEEIRIRTHARSYLHHQVRIIVGTLAEVGKGRWETYGVRDALEACDRTAAGPTAPAHGLCLTQVDY